MNESIREEVYHMIDWLKMKRERLDIAILTTPSGPERNWLTDASIHLGAVIANLNAAIGHLPNS